MFESLAAAFSVCPLSADVVFAVDASGSIDIANFLKVTEFIKTIVHNLNLYGHNQVGLELFSFSARLEFNLNEYDSAKKVLDNLGLLYYGGTTNTADALNKMSTEMFTAANGDRQQSPNIGIVITDGNSDNSTATLAEAARARNQDIVLLAVGIGPAVNQRELEGIASWPQTSNVFNVEDFDSFDNIMEDVVSSICNGE